MDNREVKLKTKKRKGMRSAIAFLLCLCLVVPMFQFGVGTITANASDPEKNNLETTQAAVDEKADAPEKEEKNEETNSSKEKVKNDDKEDVVHKDNNEKQSEPKEKSKKITTQSDEFSIETLFKIDASGKITYFDKDAAQKFGIIDLVIPDTINGVEVKAIGNAIFQSAFLETVVIPDTVTAIGDNAFYLNTKLREINLPSSLKSIGASAFRSTALVSISFPANVNSIGSYAFTSCTKLESVQLNSSLKVINMYAFSGCNKLANINLENITSIGNSAFDSTPSLTGVNIDSVTSLGSSAFKSSGLTSIKIPEGITTVPASCFESCKLNTIILPDSLQTIGLSAFSGGIVGGTTITVPSACSSIASSAFNGMANGKIFLPGKLPASVTNSPWGALGSTHIYWEEQEESCFYVDAQGMIIGLKPPGHENCQHTDYHEAGAKITIPKSVTVDGVETTITAIKESAFYANTNIKELEFETECQIKEIPNKAFDSCTSLREITFSDDIEVIGEAAFRAVKVQELILPKKLKEIKNLAFNNCTAKSVYMYDNLEKIGESAFYNCRSFTTVNWSNGLKSIGKTAFSNCVLLTKAIFSEGLEDVGEGAFAQCSKLNTVVFPASTKKLGKHLFSLCSSLKSVTILGSQPIVIDSQAFGYFLGYNPSNIRDIYMTGRAIDNPVGAAWGGSYAKVHWADDKTTTPEVITVDKWDYNTRTQKLVTYLGKGTGENLTVPAMLSKDGTDYKVVGFVDRYVVQAKGQFNKVFIEEGIETLGSYQPFASTLIKEIYFPSTLKSIPQNGFVNCKIEQIHFAEGLEEIRVGAFNNCSLSSIIFPDTLKKINSGHGGSYTCFSSCKLSGRIVIPSSTTFLGTHTFINNPNITEIYIDNLRKDVPNIANQAGSQFGATNAKIVFKGDFPECEIATPDGITKDKRAREVKVHGWSADSARNIVSIKAQDGTNIIPNANSSDIISNGYRIYENGIYTFTVATNLGSSTCSAVIDDIGRMTVDAEDVILPRVSAGAFTEKDILSITSKTAVDLDSGNSGDHKNIAYKLSGSDLAKINALSIKNQTTNVAVNAEYNDSYTNDYSGKKVDYTNKTTVPAIINVKLAGNFVEFNGNGGSFDDNKVTDKKFLFQDGKSLDEEMPKFPAKPHYTFKGWYTTSAGIGGEEFTSKTAVNSDTKVYARYDANIYTVDYYKNTKSDNSLLTSETGLIYGDKPNKPTSEPKWTGYHFQGWYKKNVGLNPGDTNKWDFSKDIVESDTKLYAGWATHNYVVTYDANGGNFKSTNEKTVMQSIKSPNTRISQFPTKPERKGYTMTGWFTNLDMNNGFDLNTEVNGNITVYANWIPNYYTLSFDLNGGGSQNIDPQILTYDSLAKSVKDPQKSDSKFVSWNTSKDGKGKTWDFKNSKMPSNDTILYAQWKTEKQEPPVVENVTDNTTPPAAQGGGATQSTQSTSSSTSEPGSNNQVRNQPSSNGNEGTTVSNVTEKTTPSVGIEDLKVPLYGDKNNWALINMVLTIAGIILALTVCVRSLLLNRREKELEENIFYEKQRVVKPVWFISTIALAIGGMLLFMITQDVSLPMVMVNYWTIFNAVIFAAEIVTAILIFRSKEEKIEQSNAF